MFAEGSVGADGAPENDARFLHGRGDDVWIVALLRRALVEEIAVSAPRFQSRLHRRSGDGLIEEAQRSLIGLQLSSHERPPNWPPMAQSTSRARCLRSGRTAQLVRDTH